MADSLAARAAARTLAALAVCAAGLAQRAILVARRDPSASTPDRPSLPTLMVDRTRSRAKAFLSVGPQVPTAAVGPERKECPWRMTCNSS